MSTISELTTYYWTSRFWLSELTLLGVQLKPLGVSMSTFGGSGVASRPLPKVAAGSQQLCPGPHLAANITSRDGIILFARNPSFPPRIPLSNGCPLEKIESLYAILVAKSDFKFFSPQRHVLPRRHCASPANHLGIRIDSPTIRKFVFSEPYIRSHIAVRIISSMIHVCM